MMGDTFDQLGFSFADPSRTSPLNEHSSTVDGGLPTEHDLAASWASSLTNDHNSGLPAFSPPDFEAFNSTGTGSPDNAHLQPAFQTGVFDASAGMHSAVLSHASSTSSLNSLSSFAASNAASSGLLVQSYPPEQFTLPLSQPASHSHSRASSISSLQEFDTKYPLTTSNFNTLPTYHVQGYDPSAAAINVAQPSYQSYGDNTTPFRYVAPKLEVDTQGLGRAIGRTRSASRVVPYQRGRSVSVSVKSEEEDIGDLMSASTSYSAQPTPWSTSQALTGGFGRMSLHHRRTSSNASTLSRFQASPAPRPMLSRARRSSTMSLKKHASFDMLASGAVKLHGTAAERQETVRKELTAQAEQVRSIQTTNQQDKARAAWVRRWLQMSYTLATGYSVPRQGLYHSYTLSCDEYDIKPINAASFGKAVRSAFPGIKTRRLGVRGNSKYHYTALRPAIKIEAERLNQYGDSSGQWHVAPEDGAMAYTAAGGIDEDMDGEDVEDSDEEGDLFTPNRSPPASDMSGSFWASRTTRPTSLEMSHSQNPRAAFQRRHTTSTVGSFSTASGDNVPSHPPVYTLPGFPVLQDVTALIQHVSYENVQTFWSAFCHHLDILVGCVRGLHFDRYELNCRTFWAALPAPSTEAAQDPAVSACITSAFAVAYDHMVSVLLDRLLSPLVASAQVALRQLSLNLESIMEEAFRNLPRDLCGDKLELTVRAAHLFIRFIDLHQLTTALAPILSDQGKVRAMLGAWDNLDLQVIADQCALSANCQQGVLEAVLLDFHRWLVETEGAPNRGGKAVERLGQWVDCLMHDLQQDGEAGPGIPLRALSTRSGFITSQIMRDFTLKSDPSFGLFQLVKTWIDDWISIASLRQTALSMTSVQQQLPQAQVQAGMSVMIPSQAAPEFSITDLNTAVPSFSQQGQSSQGQPQSSTQGATSAMFDAGAQFLTLPTMTGDGSAITPRAIFGVQTQQQQQQRPQQQQQQQQPQETHEM